MRIEAHHPVTALVKRRAMSPEEALEKRKALLQEAETIMQRFEAAKQEYVANSEDPKVVELRDRAARCEAKMAELEPLKEAAEQWCEANGEKGGRVLTAIRSTGAILWNLDFKPSDFPPGGSEMSSGDFKKMISHATKHLPVELRSDAVLNGETYPEVCQAIEEGFSDHARLAGAPDDLMNPAVTYYRIYNERSTTSSMLNHRLPKEIYALLEERRALRNESSKVYAYEEPAPPQKRQSWLQGEMQKLWSHVSGVVGGNG